MERVLDSNTHHSAYHVPVQHTHRRGRPKFDVDQAQLEYLVSLSFNWNDIALYFWVYPAQHFTGKLALLLLL